jgi:hypothetical protein
MARGRKLFSTGLVHIVRRAIVDYPTLNYTSRDIHAQLTEGGLTDITLVQVRKMITKIRASKSSRHLVFATGDRVRNKEMVWQKKLKFSETPHPIKKIPVQTSDPPVSAPGGDIVSEAELGESIYNYIKNLKEELALERQEVSSLQGEVTALQKNVDTLKAVNARLADSVEKPKSRTGMLTRSEIRQGKTNPV